MEKVFDKKNIKLNNKTMKNSDSNGVWRISFAWTDLYAQQINVTANIEENTFGKYVHSTRVHLSSVVFFRDVTNKITD